MRPKPKFKWLDHPVRLVLGVWLLSRLALCAFVTLGDSRPYIPPPGPQFSIWRGVPSLLLSPWTAYDSQFYLLIAQKGYAPDRSVFFPLFPFLMRALSGFSTDENTLALIGIIVSNLAFLGALWLLFQITRDEWGEVVARRAVWIQAFFPVVAYSGAVYTESLFLFLSLGLFWFAREKRWWSSALFGLLAGLTRNSGPILFLALLLDRPKTSLSASEKWKRFWCALCPLAGYIAFQIVLFRSGNARGLLESQAHFGRGLSVPLLPILLDIRRLAQNPFYFFDFPTWPPMVACVLAFALLWMYRREFSLGKLVFVGAVLLLDLTFTWRSEPHVKSSLRFLLATFPFVQLLALCSTRALKSPRATLYAAALGWLMFALESFHFGQKRFLG